MAAALRIARIVALVALVFAAITALWYGTVMILFAANWAKAAGVLLMLAGGRAFVFVLDATFGRPPQFSDRPWERPWEDEAGR